MKIIIRHVSEKVPENNSHVFALNVKGFVSLLLFKDNEWYKLPSREKMEKEEVFSVFWIDFEEEKNRV